MDLTKEQIEAHKQTAERYAASKALGSLIDSNHLIALCTLALRGLEGQWRPIETAPKDGTRVLLLRSHEEGFDSKRIGVGYWKNETWWSTRPGMPPSHWLPLPAPPEGK